MSCRAEHRAQQQQHCRFGSTDTLTALLPLLPPLPTWMHVHQSTSAILTVLSTNTPATSLNRLSCCACRSLSDTWGNTHRGRRHEYHV